MIRPLIASLDDAHHYLYDNENTPAAVSPYQYALRKVCMSHAPHQGVFTKQPIVVQAAAPRKPLFGREMLLEWPIGDYCGESLIDAANGVFATVVDCAAFAYQTAHGNVVQSDSTLRVQRLALHANDLCCAAADGSINTYALDRPDSPMLLAQHDSARIDALATTMAVPTLIAVLCERRSVLLYDCRERQRASSLAALQLPFVAQRIEFSPSGRFLLASSSRSRSAAVLDLSAGAVQFACSNVVGASWQRCTDGDGVLLLDQSDSCLFATTWRSGRATQASKRSLWHADLPPIERVHNVLGHSFGTCVDVTLVDADHRTILFVPQQEQQRFALHQQLESTEHSIAMCIDHETDSIFVGTSTEVLSKHGLKRAAPRRRSTNKAALDCGFTKWTLR